MFILVKKNRIHATGAESATSKTYSGIDSALRDFYLNLTNNVADESVESFDIVLLNDSLVPFKTEHFSRTYDEEE